MPRLRIGGTPPASFQRMGMNIDIAIALQRKILDVREDLLRAGDVASATKAALIFEHFVRDLRRIAHETALVAEKETRAALDASQVRPDPATNHKRLRDVIRADPWDATPNTATGTVTIGPHDVLDAVIYWRVQEFGHHFSHSPKGFFVGPGGAGQFRPSILERRLHPIFITLARANSMGMTVKRGTAKRIPPPVIKPRGFLEKGADKAAAYWTSEVTRAVDRFARELERLARPVRP
jgi:hypothetical protein